jgi:transcriptional regulator with XRE-family HTH domain
LVPFGERLKVLRQDAGLTQEGLARAASLSTSTVSKLEQRALDPSWSTVLQLAKALSVEVSAFVREDDLPPASEATSKRKGKK